ncbi:MAG: phosphatidylglycerophosphatase A [Pseudomonadota bacterium]
MTPGIDTLRDWRCALGLGLGSGLLRPAPGTWGTLAATPVAWWLMHVSLPVALAVVVVSAVVGVALCEHTAKALGVHDHPAIVWDEFAGLWLTALFAPATVPGLIAAFGLFRVFDIVKPWPIRWCDRQVDGGLGIMLDDLLAGVGAGLVLLGVSAAGWQGGL